MSSDPARRKTGRGPIGGCVRSDNPCRLGRAHRLVVLCLLAAISGWWISQAPALAFVPFLSGAKWKTLPVAYKIHQGGLPSTGNRSEFVAVHAGFEAWGNIEDSAIAFSYEGTTETGVAALDYTNLISFQDARFDSEILSATARCQLHSRACIHHRRIHRVDSLEQDRLLHLLEEVLPVANIG